jgi:tRNA(fMet)-specific endonuclease VapC
VTRLLLDTTFLIDVERGEADLDALIADDDDVAIAAISVAELQVGVELATSDRRAARQAFVDHVIDAIPVLVYDLDTARTHAELLAFVHRAGRLRGAHDLVIAATAKANGRTVVTADPSGFTDLPGLTTRTHRPPDGDADL